MSVSESAVVATSVKIDAVADPGRGPRGKLAATLGFALLLAGCTKVGPDFVKPDAPIANQWTEVGELQLNATDTDHEDWWESFNDPVL